LVAYQIDSWRFPTWNWTLVNISWNLVSAGMASIPTDPNTSRPIFAGIAWGATGQYSYISITRWWIWGNGFVVMAGTETEGWSNWVVWWGIWIITGGTTYDSIKLCKNFSQGSTTNDGNWNCGYDKNADQLRYIYLY
jgi:hypothetical protein